MTKGLENTEWFQQWLKLAKKPYQIYETDFNYNDIVKKSDIIDHYKFKQSGVLDKKHNNYE